MAKGMALNIGLNSVDPKQYDGWTGDLNGCEADAADMTDIAKAQGFKVTSLLTKEATRTNAVAKIREAARVLSSGDIYLLTYSGHGGQLPDRNDDEPDSIDETWCLYDGQLVDDELYRYLGLFEKGVRVLVFSDSCHSGTVTRVAYHRRIMDATTSNIDVNQMRYRFMPINVCLRVYRSNKTFYNKILTDYGSARSEKSVKASVLLISGCQDNQYSQDGPFNGLFTSNLLAVWKDGSFQGDYKRFHKAIVGRMPPTQTPNYFVVGTRNAVFEDERPFTI